MAWARLKRDRLAMVCLGVFVVYALAALLAQLGWIAAGWNDPIGGTYDPPNLSSLPAILGTDLFGRSVFYKVIHGARIALSVGLVSACISVPIGLILGAIAGYFGGWIDEVVTWLYTVMSSIPYIMLLIAIAYVLGRGLTSVYIAIGVTGWVGLCRVIRGEFMKHRNREYVLAAESLGASHTSRIFRHILPNVSHFAIIQLSVQFVSAIKMEVVLTFLGLGAIGQPSWGVMIDDSKLELGRGVWWQLAGATFGMLFVVLALSILGDSLRDALDPKVKKKEAA